MLVPLESGNTTRPDPLSQDLSHLLIETMLSETAFGPSPRAMGMGPNIEHKHFSSQTFRAPQDIPAKIRDVPAELCQR